MSISGCQHLWAGRPGVRHQDQFQHCLTRTHLRGDGILAAGKKSRESSQIGQPVRASRYHAHCTGILQVQTLHRNYTLRQTFFNTFTIEEVKHYVYELLIGLKNLKDLGIYHRDIKPGNFLYNPDTKRGMIIDFGLAEIDPKFQAQLEQRLARLK